jgi:hypothetical protein
MLQENDSLFDLLKRVAALRRAPNTSRAIFPARESPYKPVLLLAVLRRIQQGKPPYIRNEILFENCFGDFSFLYADLFGNTHQIETKVTQPFWYLGAGTPRIWELVPQYGNEDDLKNAISSKAQIKTAKRLQNLVSHAKFRAPDWKLIQDPDVQSALISFLTNEHFANIGQSLARL